MFIIRARNEIKQDKVRYKGLFGRVGISYKPI